MNREKFIIGICGHKQAGKDTVAGFLISLLEKSRPTFIFHIGNNIAQTLANMTGGNVETIIKNKNDPYVRGLLQHLGEMRRLREGDDIFLKEAGELIDNTLVKCFVLIPSIRHLNEYKWIKERGGLVIRVFRPEVDSDYDAHPTESGVPLVPFDHSIINDANLGRVEFYCKHLAETIIETANR